MSDTVKDAVNDTVNPDTVNPDTQTRTRECYAPGCQETLSYTNGTPITEEFAIRLGQWLTVMAESIQVLPGGQIQIAPDVKTFCSTECLKTYIDAVVAEYEDAETRAVEKFYPAPPSETPIALDPALSSSKESEVESWEELRTRLTAGQ